MGSINKVIFAVGNGIARAPMAAAIFNNLPKSFNAIAEARGIIVSFEEPLNQKTEAVLISNGMELKGYTSKEIKNEDFDSKTYVFVMEKAQKDKLIAKFESANEDNTFVLSEFVEDELEIMDPYGASIEYYGLCFETLKISIEKMIKKLEEK